MDCRWPSTAGRSLVAPSESTTDNCRCYTPTSVRPAPSEREWEVADADSQCGCRARRGIAATRSFISHNCSNKFSGQRNLFGESAFEFFVRNFDPLFSGVVFYDPALQHV